MDDLRGAEERLEFQRALEERLEFQRSHIQLLEQHLDREPLGDEHLLPIALKAILHSQLLVSEAVLFLIKSSEPRPSFFSKLFSKKNRRW